MKTRKVKRGSGSVPSSYAVPPPLLWPHQAEKKKKTLVAASFNQTGRRNIDLDLINIDFKYLKCECKKSKC